ncbi:transcription factor TFIIIB component B'' homolog isoform X2 [Ambystoma mexicanum]|uniref:transcription factor TFIIIB component B'' homolog isoform X2 n=1 Tax=Ambystoma mexicanum TaxID=8296 RepID=UPI0037E734F1
MFRRSRLSVKPNVKTPVGGRTGPAPLAAGATQELSTPGPPKPPTEEKRSPSDCKEQELIVASSISPSAQREQKTDGIIDAFESSKPSSTLLQRRKRISTVPNLAKPRTSLPPAHPPSPPALKASKRQQPQVSTSSSLENEVPDIRKNIQSISPRTRAANKPFAGPHNGLPEKRTPVPQVPQFSPFKKSAQKDVNINLSKEDDSLQKDWPVPLKERPVQEETLANSKLASKKTHQSDHQRILKAQKLRELLKKELKKERNEWKEKHPTLESATATDRSRMTMRDLIYYLPDTNPMKSTIEQEKKSEKPQPVQSQVNEPEEKSTAEPEDEVEDENSEGPLMVPRVKVAEDGTIILDEESLTIEVLRAKGPIVEENDPIFERGSTTTYSSFRKSSYSKPWSNKETDMFFLAISMVGTDFSMIGQLFPHRARIEIKNKFKREERANGWRIDKAFKEKRPFDFDFFAKLLEKILAEEEKRKQKSVKTSPVKKEPKPQRKKGKVAFGEMAKASEDPEISDTEAAEVEASSAEKENEGSLNVPEGHTIPGSATAKSKRKNKKLTDSGPNLAKPPEDGTSPALCKGKRKSKKKATEVDARTAGKENEGCMNVDGQTTPGPPPSRSKKKKSNDRGPICILSSEEDTTPELCKGQRNRRKKKRKSLNEADVYIEDATSGLEQLGCTDATQLDEDGMPSHEKSVSNSPVTETAENDNSTRDSEQVESDKSIGAMKGRVQKPQPRLITKSRNAGLVQADGNASLAGAVDQDEQSPIQSDESQLHQEDTCLATSDRSEVKVCSAAPENRVQDISATKMPSATEENKTISIKPPAATRCKFEKTKPNLNKAAGRSVVVEIDNASKDGTDAEKEHTGGEENNLSKASKLTQNSKANLLSVSKSSKEHSPETSPLHSGELQTHHEDKCLATFEKSLDHDDQTAISKSPGNGNKATLEDKSSDLVSQEHKNLVAVKPAPLLRGRLQRPKPNLVRAVGRKEVQLPPESSESLPAEAENAKENLEESEDLLCSRPHNQNVSAECKADLVPLAGQDDGKIDLFVKAPLLQTSFDPTKKLPDSNSIKQKDDCLTAHPHEHDVDLDASCSSNLPSQKVSKPDVLRPSPLIRGRLLRPRPNIGRSVEKKPTQASPSKDTNEVALSLHSAEKPASTIPVCNESDSSLHGSSQREFSESCGHPAKHADNLLPSIVPGCFGDTQSSEQEVMKPTQKRGRFQKTKPNLARATERKVVPVEGRNVPANNFSADKDKISVQCDLHSDQRTSALLLSSPDREAPASEDLCKSKSPVDTNDVVPPKRSLRTSIQSPKRPTVSELDTELANHSSSPNNYPSDTDKTKSEQELMKPTQKRGRFQKTKPNLARATERKVVPVEGRNVPSNNFSADKDKISVQCDLHSDQLTSALLLFSPDREAPASEDLCKSKSPVDTNEVVSPKRSRGSSIQSPKRPTVSELDTELAKESSSPNNYPSDTDKTKSEQEAMKPTQLTGRLQKTKPNLARATERKVVPTEERNIPSSNFVSDKGTSALCTRQTDQLLQISSPDREIPASLDLCQRKSLVVTNEVMSPQRSRRSSIHSPKRPTQSELGTEQAKDASSPTTRTSVTDKTKRLETQDKQMIPLKAALQRKLVAIPRNEKGVTFQKPKQIIKNSKNVKGKSPGRKPGAPKTPLVTLRASLPDEDEEDDDADADIDFDEESNQLAPEQINKAPVFVPKGLRSPNPVQGNVEETMEEFHISVDIPDSPCFTNVDILPSNPCVTSKGIHYHAIEDVGMEPNDATPEVFPQEVQGTNDGITEAALTLLAIGDPVLQARLSIQGELDSHGDQRDTTMQHQNHVQIDVLEKGPPCVSSITHGDLSEFKNESQALPKKENGDNIFELKGNSHNSEETTSSEKKSSGPQKPSRSRFPKPKPNLGRAVAVKRNGRQNTPAAPVKQAKQMHSAEQPNTEGTLLLKSITPQNGPSKAQKNNDAGLECLSAEEPSTCGQVDKMDSCQNERGEISKSKTSGAMVQGTSDVLEFSCRSSESNFAVLPCTSGEQKDENQSDENKQQNVSIFGSNGSEALKHDSSGDSVEEQTFILTLVEIEAPPVEVYREETTPSIPESVLPAPVLFSPTNPEMVDLANASSNESLKTGGDTDVNLLAKLDAPVTDHKSRKRNACSQGKIDELPAKKTALSNVADGSVGNACKVPQKELDIRVKEMPLKSQLTPNTAVKRVSRMNVTNWKSTPEIFDKTASSSKTSLPRPARKPLGFLPLICKKPDLENDLVIKSAHSRVEQCHTTAQEHGLKKLPLRKNTIEVQEPCHAESTNGAASMGDTRGHGSTSCPPSVVSCEVTAESKETGNSPSPKNAEPEKEPTGISEYFFSDIFMEVDDSE